MRLAPPSLSRKGVVSSHSVLATGLVSRHRVEFRIQYFEGLSILRAGGRRVCNRRGSKVLAKTGCARLEALEGPCGARELFGSAPPRSGAVWERRALARASPLAGRALELFGNDARLRARVC